jgi:hypothetical protein
MKKLLISAGAVTALALSTPAFAANNTATANATVNIVSPLTLTNTSDLNFGTIVGPFAGETVSMDDSDNENCSTLTCSGTQTSAHFDVTLGTANQNLAIVVDPTVDMDDGVDPVLTVALTGPASTVTTDGSGNASFGVGGSFSIPNGQGDGLYSGTFSVTANYQ